MKKAYVIGHVSVIDDEKWAQYRAAVPATLAPWGGELVLRGKLGKILAGQHDHQSTVVIAFPNENAVNNWYESSAYQSIIPLRESAAKIDLLSFEE